MADAKTNKTESGTGTQTSAADAITNAQGGGNAGASQTEAAAGQKYHVDGQPVSLEAYREAAAANGYDLARMPENYFPPITTKTVGARAE